MAFKESQDKITLAGVKLLVHIGTSEDERRTRQECSADLTVWADLEAASATDSLEKSIDYSQILKTMQRIAGNVEYNLIETLAYRIVRSVLQSFPVSRVRIKLRKRPTALAAQLDFVEVEVEES